MFRRDQLRLNENVLKETVTKSFLADALNNFCSQHSLKRPVDGYDAFGLDRPLQVSKELDMLKRKIDLIMKHLRINIIDVAPRPADMMVVEVTTAEEKHHE